jgi:hypothetical protein
MVLLVVTAFTGIFLNHQTFSPFHILVIVVLTTIPLAIYQYQKANYIEFKRGLFYNFVGLTLAMVGTLSPNRFFGNRIWIKTFELETVVATNIFYLIFGLSLLLAIFGIYNAIKNPKFFR